MGSLSGTGSYPFPPRSSGGGGGSSIEFSRVNRDGTKEIRKERNTDTVIPAGWASLSVYNASIFNSITVNGQPLHAQAQWNSGDRIDWPTLKQEMGAEVTIVSNGETFAFHVIYPTTSSVDVNTI